MKHRLSGGIKLALTGFAFWHLSRTVDLHAAGAAFSRLSSATLGIALACQIFQVLVSALRWHLLLIALEAPLPFARSMRLFLIGSLYGQVLPGAVGGDAVRVWQAHKAGVPMRPAINSVLLERAATLLALLLMITAMGAWLPQGAHAPPGLRLLPLGGPAAAGGLGLLCLVGLLPQKAIGHRLLQPLLSISGDCRRVFLRPRHAVPLMLTCLAGHINLCLMFWALAGGLGGVASPQDYFALVPVGILVAILPVSIAGWGLRESAMATLFAAVGMPAAISATASLLLGLMGIIGALPALGLLHRKPGLAPRPAPRAEPFAR